MSLLKRIEKSQQAAAATADRPSKLEELRVMRQPVAPVRDVQADLKSRVQEKLIAELDPKMDISQTEEVRRIVEEMFETILAQEGIILSRSEKQRLFEDIVAEILGFGPLSLCWPTTPSLRSWSMGLRTSTLSVRGS
jgi:pilus assembly protein CpaF